MDDRSLITLGQQGVRKPSLEFLKLQSDPDARWKHRRATIFPQHPRECTRLPENGLAMGEARYQRSSVAPQVKPPPIASSRMRSPFLMRPSATATDSASGIDAADVLPCLSTVMTTFSGAMPSFTADASMMRLLAWCGTNQSISAALYPVAMNESWITSVIIATACLNTSRPSMRKWPTVPVVLGPPST